MSHAFFGNKKGNGGKYVRKRRRPKAWKEKETNHSEKVNVEICQLCTNVTVKKEKHVKDHKKFAKYGTTIIWSLH